MGKRVDFSVRDQCNYGPDPNISIKELRSTSKR